MDVTASFSFDIVPMKIQMPGLGGIEGLERLRTCARSNRLAQVTVLTADSPKDDRNTFLMEVFDENVPKTITGRSRATEITGRFCRKKYRVLSCRKGDAG